MYVLTEEGRRYLDEGVPESRLVKFMLSSGTAVDVSLAKERIENFTIALAWAKKFGWVKVESGKVILLRKPERMPHQEALEKIAAGKKVEDIVLKEVISRGLVAEAREDIHAAAERLAGKEVAHLTPELIATGGWKKVKLKPYNITATGEHIWPGKRQPYGRFLAWLKQKLLSMGFKEMSGPLVETEFWNFDALFQPQNHPARDWADTYQLSSPKAGNLPAKNIVENVKRAHEAGWKNVWDSKKAMQLMPRAHTTAVSARMLQHAEVPGKYFCMGRCFRPDILDATHLVEFNQVEGIVLDPSLTFRNLLGILEMFAKEIAGAEKIRFIPDYYPFTEPSVQITARHPELGWVEFGGAGIFREELTRALGVDVPVIAWGLGVDRLAMFKLGIKDIRYLFATDIKWLREAPVI